MLSRATTMAYAIRPAVSVDWAWEGLSLSYGFAFRKSFHLNTNAVHNANNYAEPTLMFRPGGAEDLGDGAVAIGELRNTSHIVSNSFQIGYTFLEQFSAGVSLGVNNIFKYTQPLSDEYSSEYASAAGQVDVTMGGIELGYQPWENLGFALGVVSQQPAFSSDNKQLRFPFYDFVSPSNNFTAVYFDVIGTI
jgi:hypothetical protein